VQPNYTISGTARRLLAFKDPEDDKHFFDGCARRGCRNSVLHPPDSERESSAILLIRVIDGRRVHRDVITTDGLQYIR
jgi:hypothetical protein